MAITRNFDTGTSGGGGPANPTNLAGSLSSVWRTIGKDIEGSIKTAQNKTYTKSSSSSSSSSGVSSSQWTCPSGATLVEESNGSGNLVCRWNHNGAEFAAMPKAGATTGGSTSTGGATSAGGAVTGGGGSGTTGGATTGGGTGGGTTAGTTGTNGWLQSAANTFAANPEAMLAIQLQDKYGETGGNSLYGQLQPYADAANILFLAQGGNSANGGTQDDWLNYLGDYWNTLQTPGSRLDIASALSNIHNPAEGSPLHSYLTIGDPEELASNYLRLMAGATSAGYHPLIANAIMDRLGLEADRYMGTSGRGAVDPFYQTLEAAIPGFSNLVRR